MARVLAVAGGKGGAGKTFVSLSLASLAASRGLRVLLVDADVSNPSATLCLAPSTQWVKNVETFLPRIDGSKCVKCLKCVEYCPERALVAVPSKGVTLVENLCNGCTLCKLVCPVNAVLDGSRVEGFIKFGRALEIDVLSGELAVGSRREATVIQELIEEAKRVWRGYDAVIIDSPPGTSAKLYPILREAEGIAIVTEPTPLGLSDFTKFLELLDRLGKLGRAVAALNKAGLSPSIEARIKELCESRGIPLVEVPYSDSVPKAYAERLLTNLSNLGAEVLRGIEGLAKLLGIA